MFKFNKHYTKGEKIISEGEDGDRVFRIVSGEVLIYKGETKADMVALATLKKGDIFGEMHLWDRVKKRTANAIAIQDTVLEVVYDSEVNGEMMGDMLSQLSQKINQTNERVMQERRAPQEVAQRYTFKQP